LTVYKFEGALTKIFNVTADSPPRSVDLFNGTILMGLKNGSIVEMPFTDANAK
jgi:hypothetical protein